MISVNAGQFLFAMWEGGGVAPPELAVVSRLRARGHTVSVLGDPSLHDDIERAGAVFVPWREAPHRTTRTAESEFVSDWAARTPFGAFARARDRHAFGPAHLFAREVRERFASHPADVIVADALLFGALVGAESTRAKVAALLPMTSFLPAPGRPPPGIGLGIARGPLGRLRDRALEAAGDALLWRTCTPLLNRARESAGLPPVAHPLDQLRRIDRVLVQTSAWFDFDAPASSGNIRYVGPELADPSWAKAGTATSSGEPLVVVALSTTFMGQLPLLQTIVDALGALPAVVTTGPALDPGTLRAPRNVTVCESASHGELFSRASLVVTHGGHGTVIRALAHGVPLLILPMGRDQFDNAARVEAIGAGAAISRRSSMRSIRRMIERGIRDAKWKASAQFARRKITAITGDPVIEELEGLLG